MSNGIANANTFWIEAGAMSGGPRHQVEFSNDLAQFFDETSRENEIVTIRLPNGQEVARPLTYRGTDYDQWTDIWRLGSLRNEWAVLSTQVGTSDSTDWEKLVINLPLRTRAHQQ